MKHCKTFDELKIGNLYSGHVTFIMTGSYTYDLENAVYLGRWETNVYNGHQFLIDNKILSTHSSTRWPYKMDLFEIKVSE